MTDPRAGLAGHLEGLMSGIFLVVVGITMLLACIGLVVGAWRKG